MRPTGWLAAASALLCLGGWLVSSGWAQPRPSLTRAMAHLHRSRPVPGRDLDTVTRVGREV